ncbi:hypothetical protein [Falsiroseomonas oryziterrae]|uniref:hypothetical protein n=1 Tax=Falsiroseomonas oryziterrae TaxID=2911368 RepID=UPI001F190316|nr:hypothetical protein [Roseomonas sp. NPKOSM-4]
MPVIAYQSFNANSSTTHNLQSISNQHFTKQTNARVTREQHGALVLPTAPGNLVAPVEGPAHLRPIEALGAGSHGSNTVFGTQITLAWQNFYRSFGQMPDIMTIGELDTSHSDFAGMISDPNVRVSPHANNKASQSFTVISQTAVASQLAVLATGVGYVVYSVGGLVVAFVHVPNKLAGSQGATSTFYNGIAAAIGGSHPIHLVIGDTNQPNAAHTVMALNSSFNTAAYRNALEGKKIAPVDNYLVTQGGTNSTGTQIYDIAVYRSDLCALDDLAYLSQSSGAVTVTDHCGLGVKITRKGKLS